MVKIREGAVVINVSPASVVSKKMPVFYNPIMALNRDISVLLLKTAAGNRLRVADPLAGSGVRSLRLIKELPQEKIKVICINDIKRGFPATMRLNLKLNKIRLTKKIQLSNEDTSLFLLKSRGFDYIDIDPFGSPNQFLDAAAKKLNRNGILAVTATDTAALAGASSGACRRKYWAVPCHSYLMHEIGLRILIRKVQLIAGQYDKALFPLISYSSGYYMRAFFICKKGKKLVDAILAKHNCLNAGIGPLWAGDLCDCAFVRKMIKNAEEPKVKAFLQMLHNEAAIKTTGFFDTHTLAKEHKLGRLIKKYDLIFLLKQRGYEAAETHFLGSGIKSNINLPELLKLLKAKSK